MNDEIQLFNDQLTKELPKLKFMVDRGNSEANKKILEDFNLHKKYAEKKSLKPAHF